MAKIFKFCRWKGQQVTYSLWKVLFFLVVTYSKPLEKNTYYFYEKICEKIWEMSTFKLKITEK